MPEYIPHLTLGVFNTQNEINLAMNNINKKNVEQDMQIKSIQLLTFKKDDTIDSVKNYKFSK